MHVMLSEEELDALTERCRRVPLTNNQYIATDLVPTLVVTVIDYQTTTTAVERAMAHFNLHRGQEIRTLEDLKSCLKRFPNGKEGNVELALHLWGYRMWTRAEQLRGLVAYLDSRGISTLEGMQQWARTTTFKDFAGKVRGLGPVVYQWLIMRLGVDTVKPDVRLLRFIKEAIGRPVSESEAIAGLEEAARRLGIPASELDWSIWEFQGS